MCWIIMSTFEPGSDCIYDLHAVGCWMRLSWISMMVLLPHTVTIWGVIWAPGPPPLSLPTSNTTFKLLLLVPSRYQPHKMTTHRRTYIL